MSHVFGGESFPPAPHAIPQIRDRRPNGSRKVSRRVVSQEDIDRMVAKAEKLEVRVPAHPQAYQGFSTPSLMASTRAPTVHSWQEDLRHTGASVNVRQSYRLSVHTLHQRVGGSNWLGRWERAQASQPNAFLADIWCRKWGVVGAGCICCWCWHLKIVVLGRTTSQCFDAVAFGSPIQEVSCSI
ncbi:hypothetical protein FA13DRAFT_1721525 [Coprinellus micaceus]|uniref:Uncharacterized protein n=1 Tax=Coprinellus micaceus TaxID=71717 RepID=A0A4Y7S095_COPMI|nr:hypothetical protein FA13DRAFT_1721525 [Coprinellus micaceus]